MLARLFVREGTGVLMLEFFRAFTPIKFSCVDSYLYNKRRYDCLSVCLSVCIYVPYGRPNGWADRDQT